MEEICSSETSVDFQRTTRRYIPEDSTLDNLIVELYWVNLRSEVKTLTFIETDTVRIKL
jgi:hypothetical protein